MALRPSPDLGNPPDVADLRPRGGHRIEQPYARVGRPKRSHSRARPQPPVVARRPYRSIGVDWLERGGAPAVVARRRIAPTEMMTTAPPAISSGRSGSPRKISAATAAMIGS